MTFDPFSLLAAFGGGVFGAAVGGLPAFVLCGLAVLAGTVVLIVTGDPHLLNLVAWGPLLGPHAAFGGAAAAAAYAARRGRIPSGRDVLTPLAGLNAPDVLAIGGLFGLLGHALLTIFSLIPDFGGWEWTNRMALVIVITGTIARLIFGKTGIFGRPDPGRRWHPAKEADHFPWHAAPAQVLLLGMALSLPAAWLVLVQPDARGLLFGLTAVSLIFLQFGGRAPVTHHIVLSAELFALATGNLWWGLAAGLLAAWLAELFACLVLIHADTHIDPPALALVFTWTILPVLSSGGVLVPAGPLPPSIAGLVGAGGYAVFTLIRSKSPPV